VNAIEEVSQNEARFEKALRLLTEVGLSAERVARSLVLHGFPVALVRSRFPSVPESVFAAPPPTRAAQRVESLKMLTASSRPEKGRALPPSAHAITQRVLAKIEHAASAPAAVALPRSNPPVTTAVSDALREGISFQYVPLIQCSFPHADPGEQRQFTRRNGWLELTLSTARADSGLPYGVPARLLTIYCASEAVRTRSPEIFLGNTLHDFLRRLDVPITRGERGSLRVYANQLLRLLHCAISIDENIRDTRGRVGLHIRQALFVEEARLWWDDADGVGQGSTLVLSPVLYDSILERSAPLSTSAIRQLRKSPMDLDVYAWLAHRLFQLSRPSMVSWAQLSGQFGHEYGELRYFRRFFGDSLKRVLKVYPEAKLKWSDAGILLQPSRAHIGKADLTAR
jgi:hypothetical protein